MKKERPDPKPSNNNYLTVIDSNDRRLVERRLPNELPTVLSALEPYRKRLAGVAVGKSWGQVWKSNFAAHL